jgi:hypothetical protein
MGYASYTTADGREAGYSVTAHCDEDSCTVEIDRGLAYLCGDSPHGDEYGCSKFYCGQHMFSAPAVIEIMGGGLCGRCNDRVRAEHAGKICQWCDGYGCCDRNGKPTACFVEEASVEGVR